jgi:hypothetical protein
MIRLVNEWAGFFFPSLYATGYIYLEILDFSDGLGWVAFTGSFITVLSAT